MKKTLHILLFIIICNSAKAQFSPVLMVDSLASERVSQLACADFTNDGLKDILVSAVGFPLDQMILFVNLGGDEFSQLPVASLNDIRSFDVGDVNGDGRMDFAVSYNHISFITWYKNTLSGFTADTIDSGLDFTDKVLLRDFDNNGFMDLVSLQHTEIVLYLAASPGVFIAPQVIHDSTEFYAIDVADYNNDGNLDVSVASGGFEILQNDGSGNFTLHSQTGFLLSFGLQSGDIDNDNDADIVVYESAIGLVSYLNDSSGHFSLYDTVIDYPDHFRIYGLTDLDCDSDLDVYTSIGQARQLIRMENTGTGNFGPHAVVHTETGALLYSTTAADMNNDSKTDLIWGAFHIGLHYNECSALSVNEAKQDNVLIFPNPAGDHFNVCNTAKEDLYFTLYDISGRKIALADCLKAETITFQLPVPGMYLLEGRTVAGERVISKKIIR